MPNTTIDIAAHRKAIHHAIFFGLLAAAGYALQHPFSRPIARRLGSSPSDFLWLVIISQVVSLLIGAFLFLIRKELMNEVVGIFKEANGLLKVATIALSGIAGLVIYVYAISVVNQVFLSVVLNVYPIWSVVLGSLFFKSQQKIGHLTLVLFFVCFVSMVYFGYMDKDMGGASIIYAFLFSSIPILYALNFWLRRKFFMKDHSPSSFVVATQVFDAPFIILISLVLMHYWPPIHDMKDVWAPDIALYVTGSVASFAALYWLHKGAPSDTVLSDVTWIPSFMLFLVPSFVALFSIIMTNYFGFDLGFNARYLYLIAILTACLIIYCWGNHEMPRSNKT